MVAAGVSLEPAPRKGVRTPVPTTSGNNGEKRHGEAKAKALEDGKKRWKIGAGEMVSG